MPELEVTSNAKPSLFGYPAKLEERKDKTREKVETAILSITAKHKKKKGEKTPATDTETNKAEKMDTVSWVVGVQLDYLKLTLTSMCRQLLEMQ